YEGALGDDIYTSGDDGANWSEILNLSLARMKHTAIYDPTLHRMVVFGGNIDESTEQLVNDAWELSLGTPGTEAWTQLTPAGTAPTVREDHAAAFDPVQDRMIVFGGHTTGGGGMDLNDTWMLSFDTTAPGAISDLNFKSVASTAVTLKWTATGDDGTTGTACHDDVRWSTNPITDDASFAAATQAPNAPAPSAAGAQDTLKISGLPRNVWLYFALKVSDEAGNTSALSNVPCVMLATPYKLCDGGFAMRPVAPEAAVFALDAIHPNPAPGRTTVEFRLPSADPATLELIDLAGRQVWQAEVGGMGGGSHVLEVGGRDHVLAPGFYLVRLRGVRGSVSRSVVITR
ncbi:MAG TPA: T9SS type A sorting domain-containing protein, partial [Candidatus Eisenbacteria bacterium]|nr:T9SS type A sorting domain-containing protein [Candidatus Eisenbacteria bacterium]